MGFPRLAMPLIPVMLRNLRQRTGRFLLAVLASYEITAFSNAKAAEWPPEVIAAWKKQMKEVAPKFLEHYQETSAELVQSTAKAHALTDSQIATLTEAIPALARQSSQHLQQFLLEYCQEELHGSSEELIAKLEQVSRTEVRLFSLPYHQQPEMQAEWAAALRKVLSPPAFATWEADKQRRLEERRSRIQALLQASKAIENPAEPLAQHVAALLEDLNLEALKAPEQSAIHTLIEAWKSDYVALSEKLTRRALEVADDATLDSFSQMIDEGSSVLQPPPLVDWLQARLPALLDLLPEPARTAFERQREQRHQRAVAAQRLMRVLVVDILVPLSDDQQDEVSSAAQKLPADNLETFVSGYQSDHWTAWQKKPASDQLAEILDDLQERLWTQGVKQWSESRLRQLRHEETATTSRPPERHPGLGPPDPEAVEAAVSEFLAQDATQHAQTVLPALLRRAEEAVRVLGLDETARNRLAHAARGTMEQHIEQHLRNQSPYVRSQMKTATAQNIQQRLASFSGYSFHLSEREDSPFERELVTMLSPAQNEALAKHQARVLGRRHEAQVAFVLVWLDRALNLSESQFNALRKPLAAVMQQYGQDMDAVFSSWGDRLPWFLQSYYACLPLAGLSENDLRILTPRQKQHWEQEIQPHIPHHWDQVLENHQDRVREP